MSMTLLPFRYSQATLALVLALLAKFVRLKTFYASGSWGHQTGPKWKG